MSTLDAIAADVRTWYDDYVETFRRLAAGENTDLDSLFVFYGVPLVIATESQVLVLPDDAAVLGIAQTIIDQLRQANYAHSTIRRLDIRPLNARAAVIDSVFSRHNHEGTEFERIGVAYLAVKTEDGWRFTSLITTTP